MLKWLNNKKKDNKGFSLVELIIVVAIMAILVGLLAPQYLKYVEKSRKSADASNINEMVNAIQVYAADSDNELPADTYTITVSTNAAATITAGKTANQTKAVAALTGTVADYASIRLKSSKWAVSGGEDVTSLATVVTVLEDGSTTVTYGDSTKDQLASFVNNTKK